VWQCVAVCCKVLPCVACVAVCSGVLQCFAVCFSVLMPHLAQRSLHVTFHELISHSVLYYDAQCCSVVQCAAICSSELQYFAVCCTVP